MYKQKCGIVKCSIESAGTKYRWKNMNKLFFVILLSIGAVSQLFSAKLIEETEYYKKFLVESPHKINAGFSIELSKNNSYDIYNYTLSVDQNNEFHLHGFQFIVSDLALIEKLPGSSEMRGTKYWDASKKFAWFRWRLRTTQEKFGYFEKGKSFSNLICIASGVPGIIEVRLRALVPGVAVDYRVRKDILTVHPPDYKPYKTIYTIGPVPKPQNQTSMIDHLIATTTGAYREGWISKADVYQGLMDKLVAAKENILKGRRNYHTARNIIGAFKHLLDAQRGKAIDEPCYQMLYINADEMIKMLGG